MADKVSIDIPGVGLVEANNAAQESTLRNILAAIEKSGSGGGGGGGGSTAAVDKANTKAKKENTDETEKNTDRMEEWGRDAAKAVKSVGKAATGVVAAFTGGGGAVDALKAAGDVIEKAMSGIPIAGAGLGAAFGFLVAQVTGTMANFESAQAAGASFGNSMMTLKDVASQAGITMGQLAAVAKQAGESLSMFGGGTAQGARDFAKFNGAVRNSGMDKQMVRMGMSFQDQAIAMADYTGQLATFGENVSTLDTQSVAKNFFELTKQQKMLSQYNGISIEQQRQDMKAKQKDVNLRALTMGMDAKQQEAAGALAQQLQKLGGPVAEQYMKEMLAHGGAVSAETALFAQSFPELAKIANEGAAGLKAGTLETADTMRLVGQIDPAAMKAQAMAAGEQLRMTIGTGVSNPLTEMIGQTLVPALDTQAKAINQTAAKIQADNAELAKPVDQLTESYIKANQEVQNIAVAMEGIALGMMNSDAFRGALNIMTDTMTTAAKKLAKIAGGKTVFGMDATKAEQEEYESENFIEKTGTVVSMGFKSMMDSIAQEGSIWQKWRADRNAQLEKEQSAGMELPGKAAGGPVNAGSKYQVNEIGQEIFTPSTRGTISPHSAYKNIMSDMSGMKAQISKQQASESNAPVTAEAAMARATRSSSNPFSEDQEVRNALISLPSIMMENMNHLQTVNNTLEVKLTELSRNVA